LAIAAVDATIYGWAPGDWFPEHATGVLGVPIEVGLGVPLFSNATGVLPLVEVLSDKGLPMGTVLAFTMSVVALSIPEMILLRRVLKPELIATYVGVVASGILLTGFAFNLILQQHTNAITPKPTGVGPWTSRSSAPDASTVRTSRP